MGFLDLIFETQISQFLQGSADKKNHYYTNVHEEIFLINVETKTILNYLTIVEYPNSSLIHMLTGPATFSIQEKAS